jgi:hypothetical protein
MDSDKVAGLAEGQGGQILSAARRRSLFSANRAPPQISEFLCHWTPRGVKFL